MNARPVDVSILVPVFDEADNLETLHGEIVAAVEPTGRSFEIVLVDDGSTDGSVDVERALAHADPRVKVLLFKRNFGQTAALAAAIEYSRGNVLVPMDADLQNDPADVPAMLGKLEEGYDIVSGWRKNRKDPWLTRVLPSKIANGIVSWVTKVNLHDFGCSLKAYRREVLADVKLYGEMHRYTPVYASWQGGRVTEMVVNHRPRKAGKSKYGLLRTLKVVLDLVTVKLLGDFSTKPIYFFGGVGLVLMGLGVLSGIYSLIKRFFLVREPLYTDPFALFAVFLFLSGLICVMMGLLAELIVRTYHESQNKRIYALREIIAPQSTDPADGEEK